MADNNFDIDTLYPNKQELALPPEDMLYVPENWLKPSEVGPIFGVDTKTVYRWSRSNKKWRSKVRSFKTLGGHNRYYRPDVEDLRQIEELRQNED